MKFKYFNSPPFCRAHFTNPPHFTAGGDFFFEIEVIEHILYTCSPFIVDGTHIYDISDTPNHLPKKLISHLGVLPPPPQGKLWLKIEVFKLQIVLMASLRRQNFKPEKPFFNGGKWKQK